MKKLTFDDVKEIRFYKTGDEIETRLLFERNLNTPDSQPIILSFRFPYGRTNMDDAKLKAALKTWIEDTVLPEINADFDL